MMRVKTGPLSILVTARLYPIMLSILERFDYGPDEVSDECLETGSFEVLPGDFEAISSAFKSESREALRERKVTKQKAESLQLTLFGIEA